MKPYARRCVRPSGPSEWCYCYESCHHYDYHPFLPDCLIALWLLDFDKAVWRCIGFRETEARFRGVLAEQDYCWNGTT